MSKVVPIVLFLLLSAVARLQAEPLVLFEEGHGQAFHAGADGELDLSLFAEQLRTAGARVAAIDRLDQGALGEAAALVISGPFRPFTAEEIEEVLAFLDRGGRLAVMLHIGPPAAGLLARLGIYHSNGVVRETRTILNGNPLDFQVTHLEEHPILHGLENFSLFGAWALLAEGDSAVIARTGTDAWIDLNGDQKLSGGDVVDSFGVAAAGKRGAGRFVVFGDDAIFQNRYLRLYNGKLGERLARWLRGED